jgi:hypothetical protein
LSPGHAYSAMRNHSRLQKFIRWGLSSTYQWRRSLGWHAVGGILESDKKAPSPLLYHLSFMVGLTEEVPSSMVLEPRSWVQFPRPRIFFH